MDRASAFAEVVLSSELDRAVMLRAIKLEGFGGREAGEVLVDLGDRQIGNLLGQDHVEVVSRYRRDVGSEGISSRLVMVELGDRDAIAAGLACGGVATVLVQTMMAMPDGFAKAISERVPATLVTDPDLGTMGCVIGVRDAIEDRIGEVDGEVRARILGLHSQARDAVEELVDGDRRLIVEVFAPPSRLVIVGSSGLAWAITRQAEALGWTSVVVDTVEEGLGVVGELGPNDGLILLSHDHQLTTPLAASLISRSPLTYLGSLGSRHTQAVRRQGLSDEGIDVDTLRSLFGPVGLDLGAKTPQETALAICAEFLAYRSGRSGVSLRGGSGPING